MYMHQRSSGMQGMCNMPIDLVCMTWVLHSHTPVEVPRLHYDTSWHDCNIKPACTQMTLLYWLMHGAQDG